MKNLWHDPCSLRRFGDLLGWITVTSCFWVNAPSRDLNRALGADEKSQSVRLTHDGFFKQRPAWSPDGQWLAFARHRGSTIYVYLRSADGRQERRLTRRELPEFDAVWSPDGKRLLFALDKASPNQGDMEIYSIDSSGGNLTPVVVTEGKLSHEESPCWSPDGKQIAYTSTRDGNQELYVALSTGREPQRLTSNPAIDAHPAWSPDGERIAFSTNRWGDLELAMIDPDGEHLVRLTHSPGLDDYPAWSPDGKYLAYTSNRDGNLEIYVADADGQSPRNVTCNLAIDNFGVFTPDGRLTFVSNRSGEFDIYMMSQPK